MNVPTQYKITEPLHQNAYLINGELKEWTGKTTETAKIIDIERAAKKIYEDYPELLKALGL